MPLDDKARTEINEMTDTLKSNFDKVVHHGRRADAIVKNMLQHSREGSGEHRVLISMRSLRKTVPGAAEPRLRRAPVPAGLDSIRPFSSSRHEGCSSRPGVLSGAAGYSWLTGNNA